jgi:hypothetical protein
MTRPAVPRLAAGLDELDPVGEATVQRRRPTPRQDVGVGVDPDARAATRDRAQQQLAPAATDVHCGLSGAEPVEQQLGVRLRQRGVPPEAGVPGLLIVHFR